MRISIKCSTAVHMLLIIARLQGRHKVTSDFMATSAGCNPVEIRKLMGSLKNAGIIEVARGTGGASLLKDPKDITLLDIYAAVDEVSVEEFIGIHQNSSDRCPYGRNIKRLLTEAYTEIGQAIHGKMTAITLERFIQRLEEIEPELDGPVLS
ncbi:Rrf2 family transcriptional regulator [Breznakiella homolactica]|uniref:Rrf2 family transcriptional regulator n=1 Tax=Breznakiella homolactica TaxID=2798577 RepID=A0A7T8B8S3_9SPIR|nr:Rrf2 family transcriptional regulator [Breznakiella homolactica]QQO07682.1 Rrf2 family transcriptional regulator [Breznakiella homolactica]